MFDNPGSCNTEYCIGVTCTDQQVEDRSTCKQCGAGYEFGGNMQSAYSYNKEIIGNLCVNDNTDVNGGILLYNGVRHCPGGYADIGNHPTSQQMCSDRTLTSYISWDRDWAGARTSLCKANTATRFNMPNANACVKIDSSTNLTNDGTPNPEDWFDDDADDSGAVDDTPNPEDAPSTDDADGSPSTGNNSNADADGGGRSSNTTSDQTVPNANAGGLSGDTAGNADTDTTTTTPDASQSVVDDASKIGTSTAVVAVAAVASLIVIIGLASGILFCRKKQSQQLQLHPPSPPSIGAQAARTPAPHNPALQHPYGTAGAEAPPVARQHLMQPYGDSAGQSANVADDENAVYDNAEIEAAGGSASNGGQQSSVRRCQYKQPGPTGQRCKAKTTLAWCVTHGCETPSCPNCKSSRAHLCDSCQQKPQIHGGGGAYDVGAGGGDGDGGGGVHKFLHVGFDECNVESML